MISPLTDLGLELPVLAAPMAGGPTTPELVIAAAGAGSIGFLAGGYKTAQALAEQIAGARSAGVGFGVNLFAPSPVPVDPGAFRAFARAIAPEARAYGLDSAEARIMENDDHWEDKIDLLVSSPVPVVSFTFGIPEAAIIAALRASGTLVVQTVTSPLEARTAAEAGVDVLAVQAAAAGGHSGTWTPHLASPAVSLPDLLKAVHKEVPLPLVAAGGIATPDTVTEVLGAGAAAVMAGTVLLRADEAGTSAPYRAALADPARRQTVMTRAFSGRPARALRNDFTDRYSSLAPDGYPALHHLTSPMRRAAASANDPERINLWAGTGYRHATAEPTAQILHRLASRV
ncbi:nitronate monooxygenase [Streptomyces sp. 35G-GA-8]|uniref:NAD(P)H-dependent flavin oxidoreductase n=1 Tax=Streptomyces sp. 35G-GA-8 TaxID=2939434 RepID=UPI00201F9460|nr:nitronate monooxygenase [Streptomyces sp. 35G-GA-8]MCL7382594.1 nitronate monooxygenase [Streptomyces sp. 35G-GA-8]